MPPNLKHLKHPHNHKRHPAGWTPCRHEVLPTGIHDPRLRRRTEQRPPRVVHDDALWHEGPDQERMGKTTRREGPREPQRDRPTPDADIDRR